MRPAATYSPNAELGVSTIGPGELNCRVRNGNGCDLSGDATDLIPVRYCKRTSAKSGFCPATGADMFCPTEFNGSRVLYLRIKEYGQASRPISTG